jgi:DNA-binding transcriptional LysR family regulator
LVSKQRISNRQIEAFMQVAESNSFTGAAQRMRLTNSAISSLIAELENAVGARLFARSTRRVVLNEYGRQFLPAALSFMRTLRDVERIAESLGDQSADTVRVAATMVIASAILPSMIAEFQAQHPECEVNILDTGVEWLADRVATGEADFAVGPDRSTEEAVTAESLLPSKWVVWLSPEHPLAQKDLLRWRDLKGVQFHTGGHDHDRILDQAMAGLDPSERVVPGQVFDNISTALGLAAAGVGVTLCPAYVAPLASAFRLEMRRLIDPEFTRFVMLYSPVARPIGRSATAFADLLRRRFKELEVSQDS